MEKNIVIIGGGFGGLAAAKELGKLRSVRKGHRIIVLDKSNHHLYTPLLYEVATGFAEKMPDKKLSAGVTSHLASFAKENGFEFYKGAASSVNFAEKKIMLSDGSSLDFAALVLATGAETDFYGINGLKEHALTLKTLEDALRIKEKIREHIGHKHGGHEVQIEIVVGGGGATGVEFSAELAGSFRHMERKNQIFRGDWSVTLVEAGPRILSMLGEKVSYRSRMRLEQLGVKVLRDTCIKKVEEREVVLSPRPLKSGENPETLLCDFSPKSEHRFHADVVVWAGGVRANALPGTLGLPTDEKGRVLVSDTLEVKGKERENVYALGDCARIDDPKTGKPAPALAQAAMEQAAVLSANIAFDLEGLKTRRHYKPRAYSSITPLGGRNAIAVIGGSQIWGVPGWIIRQGADLRYFISIMPVLRAVRVWLAGALIYTKND